MRKMIGAGLVLLIVTQALGAQQPVVPAAKPEPVASRPDDFARRGARDAAARLWHRRRGRHAQAAGHRRHRLALHFGPAVIRRHADRLLHPQAGGQKSQTLIAKLGCA